MTGCRISVLTYECETQKKAAEKKEKETKANVVQVDDLLTFRQFSKKTADDAIDVSITFVLLVTPDANSLPVCCSMMKTSRELQELRRSRKTSSRA